MAKVTGIGCVSVFALSICVPAQATCKTPEHPAKGTRAALSVEKPAEGDPDSPPPSLPDASDNEIIVFATTQSSVQNYSEEETRNIRNYNDLLKPIAGVAANDFDQGGVGYGLTLRGFSERSNGGNVALFIDGVPVNLPGNRSSNGYGDLSPLIPELIDSFELIRGPFDVRAGPFELAGSARYETRDAPSSGAVLKGGSHGFGRAFAAYTIGHGATKGYGSLMLSTTDGYRDNSKWRQLNSFNKLTFPVLGGSGSLRLQIYDSDYGSPGFISRDRIRAGTLDEKAARNPSDGGNTTLGNLVFNYKQDSDSPIAANAYLISWDQDRYSSRGNTIPVLATTPGVQFLTTDKRTVYGGMIEKRFRTDLAENVLFDLLIGGGVRVDDVASNEFRTTNRIITGNATTIGTLVNFGVTDLFGYVEANLSPVSWLKLTAGVRYDRLDYDIADRTRPVVLRVNSVLDVWHPTAGVILTPVKGLDLFANYGRGFRPPSPIGSTQLLFNRDFPEATLKAREVGVLYKDAVRGWRVRASYFHTSFTDEIFGQPPPLTPILLGPSVRKGYDIEAQAVVLRSRDSDLSIYASYSNVDGRLKAPPVGQGSILPEFADFFVKYGFDYHLHRDQHSLDLSFGQVWEGPKPLDSRGVFRTRTFSRIDANLSYANDRWKGVSVFANAIVYPDRRLEETAFVFANQVGVAAKPRFTLTAGTYIPF